MKVLGPCVSVPTAQLRQEACARIQATIQRHRGKIGALLPVLPNSRTKVALAGILSAYWSRISISSKRIPRRANISVRRVVSSSMS